MSRWGQWVWVVGSAALGCGGPTPPQPTGHPAASTSTSTSEPASTTTSASTTLGSDSPPESSGSSSGPTDETTVGLDTPSFDVGGPVRTVVCSGDLKSVLDATTGLVLEQCPPHEGCLDGACVPACVAAAGAHGSIGCEFAVPTPPFFANGDPTAVQSGPCHAIVVVNPWDRPALLELSWAGVDYDVVAVARRPVGIGTATVYEPLPPAGLPPDEVAVIFAAHRPGVHNGNSLQCPIEPAVLADTAAHGTDRGTAFAVHSDTPIQVYDMLPYGGAPTYLPSASLQYPVSAWAPDYIVPTPHPKDHGTWLLVVATADGTTVSLEPTAVVDPGTIAAPSVGAATSYLLDAGQSVQWHAAGDLAGTRLSADAPIGVWSGNTFLRVTTTDSPLSGRDSAHQMVPDVWALGTRYVAAPATSRRADGLPESTRYRLVGVADDTELSWDPPTVAGRPPVSLSAGQVVEFETTEAFAVHSQNAAHPFSLSQYMGGAIEARPGCLDPPGACRLGDDEWVVLPSPDQFGRAYSFFVDPTYGTTTLTVVRERHGTDFRPVLLHCLGELSGWHPLDEAGRFEWVQVELFRSGHASTPACATSQHRLTSPARFGAVVWGTDHAASYGYPVGGNLHTINELDLPPAD